MQGRPTSRAGRRNLRRLIRSALAALILAAVPSISRAEIFVKSVFPGVIQRGVRTRIELTGTEIEQVVGLWTSIPGAGVHAVPVDSGDGRRAEFDIEIPAEAPLGIYGLRLATRSGLSNTHLFAVDELPVTSNYDPGASDPKSLPLPACVACRSRRAAIDRFRIEVSAGQRVAFEVVGNRLGKDFDPVLTLRDSRGRLVAQHDNSPGLFGDMRFEHRFAEAGAYLVEVCDSRYDGLPGWNYALRMGDFPSASAVEPATVVPAATTNLRLLQAGNPPASISLPPDHPHGRYFAELRTAPELPAIWAPLWAESAPVIIAGEGAVPIPGIVHGILEESCPERSITLELVKGDKIEVQSEARRLGSPADLELVLFEPDKNQPAGREVMRTDETTRRDNSLNTTFIDEASFRFTARTDSSHRLVVRDLAGRSGSDFAWRVAIRREQPKLVLVADVGALALPRGTWQPLPLKITREGFSGEIELRLIGAPLGVRLEPTTIPDGESEFTARLTVDPETTEGLATLQVVGVARSGDLELKAIATTHPLVDRQPMNKDRILFALRENQRELPPSVTDRIALQITEPAPFDFDLPEAEAVLPKYLTAEVPVATKRNPAMKSSIEFTAAGGQIGDESEERVQIFARFPPSTVNRAEVSGTLYTRILTRYEKHRVDVTGTAIHDGRRIALTRTFSLDVRSAFAPKFDPETVSLEPGQSLRTKIQANRVDVWTGAIVLHPQNPPTGIRIPERLEIPAGAPELEFEIQAALDLRPGRYQLRFESTGTVDRYEELLRSPVLTVEIKAPAPPAKPTASP